MGEPPATTLHDVPLKEALPYAITDAVATRLAFDPLYQRLNDAGLERVYHIDMGAIPLAAHMMKVGMAADKQRFHELSSDLGTRVVALDKQMFGIIGKEFDPDSPDQLANLLYDELKLHEGSGVRMKRTPKTGRFVVNDDILQALRRRHPVVPPLVERRELAKLKNSFADVLPLLIGPDGRIRTTLRVTRIASGRFCAHSPNLQQIPTRSEVAKLVRKCFVAPAGKLLCSMDLAGIELVWAAQLSGDEFLCRVLNEGRDIHSEGASLAYGKPAGVLVDGKWYYEIDKATQRDPWKTAGFLILYGGTAMGLSDQLIAMGQRLVPLAQGSIAAMQAAGKGNEDDYASFLRKAKEGAAALAKYDEKESQRLIDEWFKVHKGVYQWTQDIHQQARLYGYVTDYFNRRTWVPQVRSSVARIREEGLRLAVNTVDQGSAASTLKIVMALVWKELKRMWSEGKDVDCIMTVHDELIFEHPEGMEQEVQSTFQPCFENAVQLRVPVKSSASWAKDWAGLK